MSPASLESHLRLYEGYVHKFNQMAQQLAALLANGPANFTLDTESLKTDMTFALSAIKNHELYFDNLSQPLPGETDQPTGALAEAIVKSFHSVPQYLVDLKQTANQGRGWAWTAYDLDHDYLVNYGSGTLNAIPVWNCVPILAIDLYGHAYFYDYGNNRLAYIESLMQGLNWEKISQKYLAAKKLAVQRLATV